MTRHVMRTALATAFFFGLFTSNQEYGSLSGALRRTMAQALPPYHETQGDQGQKNNAGQAQDSNAPVVNAPPASSAAQP